jgi:hypothetical protein
VNAYQALLAGESYDPSSKAASLPTETQIVDNGSAHSSGGGGGCFIDETQTAGNYTSFVVCIIMIVLFQIRRKRDLE